MFCKSKRQDFVNLNSGIIEHLILIKNYPTSTGKQKMFHILLRRRCILLLLDGIFGICLLDLVGKIAMFPESLAWP